MANTIFYIIIGIILFDYLLERFLDYLNQKNWSNKIPKLLDGIYDDDKYQESQRYKKVNHSFEMLTSTFSAVVILAFLFLKGFAWIDSIVYSVTDNNILAALLFFGIIGFANDIISLPFSIYHTFIIEEKFGFNKTTVKTFIIDKIKGWLMTAILGGGIFALIIWIYTITQNYFWIIAWGVITVITLFMTMFYSNLIVPLFNKQTPLEDGELKDAINAFAKKAGFQLKNIFVIDGSKRSTKANAYFTGIGPKKRIVLYDTLINDLSTQEIVAVLAHEIGHYKKKHVLTGLFLGVIQTGLLLFIFSLLVSSPALSEALGVNVPKFHIGLIAFGILYSPLSTLTGILMNLLSRKNEYEADEFANSFGLGEHLINGLKKLTRKNLSNLTPHPAYVFFHYSHPTLLQRIKRIQD